LFKKVLVANRGEIALRIIRACKDLNIQTTIVYSEADKNSLPVSLANESICIGPSVASQSYLKVSSIINVALLTGVDAIHPGYGFLAENAHFAEVCREHKIKFIGPSPEIIKKMGDKAQARKTVENIGIPTVPGSKDLISDFEEARALAKEIEYPILIKATAGGGGKGMRIVQKEEDLEAALFAAGQEAEAAFGNSGVYLEKFIRNMKHIEFQIFSDLYGETVHLGERDCSIQRRHQKLIEESPSPVISSKIRQKMGKAAIKIAKSVEYEGAGTVEFIFDLDTNQFYFMEMNTRIQVEHPVTEIITQTDLVKEQIKVAYGEKLSFEQAEINSSFSQGHCFEFRINAEDPKKAFCPTAGTIESFIQPGGIGVRTDTHIFPGYEIPPFYDSLIAKLIVFGKDRSESLGRAVRALDELLVKGPAIKTTANLFKEILQDPIFQEGKTTTKYLDYFLDRNAQK